MTLEVSKNSTRILIVDDDPVVRRLLTISLNRQSGLTVCAAAENASQALEILEKQPVDLAIVDISLNGTSGLELTERINLRWPDLLVLIFSSHNEAAYVRRAFRRGARGYVVKHLDVSEELSGAIYEVLAGKIYVSQRISE